MPGGRSPSPRRGTAHLVSGPRGGRPPGRSVRIAVSRSGRTPPPCGCTRRPIRGSPRSRSRTRRQEASRDKGFAPQGFMMASKVALPVGELVPRFKEEQVFIIEAFLVHCLRESGRKGVVLGLSGGVDSALVAKLCADALGPQRVLAVAMPDGRGGKDLKDAKKFAKMLGIDLRIIGISPIVTSVEKRLLAFQADQVARGNLRARARMIVLYFIANTEGRIVMGTGNKSELLTGYFTLHGDGAADFLPIGDLYKTQVREMARYLALLPEIVEKVPTAGLWPGQTDEAELGISYDELDRILLGIELQLDPETIAQKGGVPLDHVTYVQKLVASSIHKRKMPLIPKVGARTIGLDWRE